MYGVFMFEEVMVWCIC